MKLIEERYVQPFYLAMMRTNAAHGGAELVPAIVEASRTATPEDVVDLLRSSWRPRVMGAWLALRQDDPKVKDALLASLRTCSGSLTSPPLATAAVLVVGLDAVVSLEQYMEVDLAESWGGAGFAAAAIEHLWRTNGETVTLPQTTPEDRKALAALLRVAEQLRDA